MTSKHTGGGRNRFKKYNRGGSHSHVPGKTDKTEPNVDESSPLIQAFRAFQKELDSRNDRHERIVKLSRDITIESKRIIFLLQRCAGSEEKESVLSEAIEKFQELSSSKFYPLAQELEGQDPYQFLRAYSPGLQEYIEAVTFYHYLLNDHLVGRDQIQSELTFAKTASDSQMAADIEPSTDSANFMDKTEPATDPATRMSVEEDSLLPRVSSSDVESINVTVPVPFSEYMLGVADFSGELMRMAINSVGAGDLDTPALVTKMMRTIHGAFTTFNNPPRELRQKTRVLSQSLQKVEQACYTLRVRGSEIPKHMLADVFSSAVSTVPMDSFTTDETEDHFL